MGNKCPDLTLFAGIACKADYIVTADRPLEEKELIESLKKDKEEGKDCEIVLISEKLYDLNELTKHIKEQTGWDTRNDVLGYIQRGGAPTAMERFNSIRMGSYAVELLDQGIGGVCVGLVNNELKYFDILEALDFPRNKHLDLYKTYDLIK